MTITSPVSRVDVAGNSSATTFSFAPVTITQASDLDVWILDNLGNQSLLTQGTGPTNYVVVVSSYPGTGSITYPGFGGVTLPTGWKLTMKQRVPLLQNFQPQNQGPFLAGTYGAAYDYLMLAIQEVQEEISRTFLVPETDPAITQALPSATARANHWATFDSAGNMTASLAAAGTTPVSVAMAPVVNAATIAAAVALLGVAPTSSAMTPVVAAATVQAALNLLTANAITQSLTGHFYASDGGRVNRIADRLLVGQAVSNSGNLILPPDATGDWLDVYQSVQSLEPTANAQFASLQDDPGQIGILGGARSLNHTVAPQSSIGVAGYVYNNNTTLASGAWGFYGEVYKKNNIVGNSYGMELAIVNQSGTQNNLTPYNSSGHPNICYQADSGSGFGQDIMPGLCGASAAYVIAQNTSDASSPFIRGLIAMSGSIGTNAHGIGEVVSMGVNYGFQWFNSSGDLTSTIYSGATVAAGTGGLAFTNAGMSVIASATGAAVATFVTVASSVNYLQVQPAAAAAAPGIYAQGSDTDVGFVISAKGTGAVLFANGPIPIVDNSPSCGSSGHRWSTVWAANGTIQTSDPRLKTDMAPLSAALPMVAAVNPIQFKWKSGGSKQVPKQVEIEEDVYEEGDTTVEEPQLQPDGTYRLTPVTTHWRRPVTDEVPVLDAAGNPVIDILHKTRGGQSVEVPTPRMHTVTRTQKKMVTEYDWVEQPGQRTHYGFRADEIKAATPPGADWGAYVLGEDGTEHIRPDQLIPVLWKSTQELHALVVAQQTELSTLKDLIASLVKKLP